MNPRTTRLLHYVSLAVLLIGAALLAMMVATEGEPGALPLALVVLGTVGMILARRRQRSGGG